MRKSSVATHCALWSLSLDLSEELQRRARLPHHLHYTSKSLPMSQKLWAYIRTLLQNSMTILGDVKTTGATKVAGSVRDSLGMSGVACCWSQFAQFGSEPVIGMKHDKSSKGQVTWHRPLNLSFVCLLSKSSGRRRRQRRTLSSAPFPSYPAPNCCYENKGPRDWNPRRRRTQGRMLLSRSTPSCRSP